MNLICPVCKKEYAVSLEAARHVMGTGDKKHRDWLASEGENYGDLLVLQATNPGNASYMVVANLIEKAQDKLKK
jgi:Cu/Zn superoxide dismutase